MKSIFAAVGLLVAAVSAQQLTGAMDLDHGKTRESIGHKYVPGGVAPKKQELVARFPNYYPKNPTKRIKMRYGPYHLQGKNESNLFAALTGEPGTMTTIGMWEKPCDTCNLVLAQAGLEYADGSVADVTNGAWLHHIVVIANGKDYKGVNRVDTVCKGLPFNLLGERFFSSGNERTPTSFGDILNNKIISAFPVNPTNSFLAQIELMNMENTPKDVYITVDYELIPGPKPDDVKVAKAMWFDIANDRNGCGISAVFPPQTTERFTRVSTPWTASFNGQMLGVGGHLHDGGLVLNTYQNDNVICASKANYGMGGGHAHGRKRSPQDGPKAADGRAHIQTMSTCTSMGAIKKGDKFKVDVEYNFGKYDGMKSPAGKYTEIMGIAIMYAAADE